MRLPSWRSLLRAQRTDAACSARPRLPLGSAIALSWLGLIVAPLEVSAQTAARPAPVSAVQTPSTPRPVSASQAMPTNSQMLLQADQLIYDNDRQLVIADGSVQIFYEGYTVTARKVTYNRQTRRLIADGEVRIVDPRGIVTTGANADLTDTVRDGFVRSVRLETPERVRFAADSAERRDGETTIFNRGVYTACETCRDNPQRPPLWQVKAARIIHRQTEETIYFEDARLEFFGVPIAYVPYFWAPDPTVQRKSGFLFPRVGFSNRVGFQVGTPYYFALSPHYDLTVTPTWTSRQGPHLTGEFRHQLPNGAYSVRLSGIRQLNPTAVGSAPTDEGRGTFRGAIQTQGEFLLSPRWRAGWNVTVDSDRRYLKDFNFAPESQRESISSVYVTGFGDRSFFDLRAQHFRPLLQGAVQHRQNFQPWVLPVLDYNTVLADPLVGGEFAIRTNVTNISRQEALTYTVTRPGQAADFYTPSFAGNYVRASVDMTWRRSVTDPLGVRWTPFAGLRGDVSNVSPGQQRTYTAISLTNPANIFNVPTGSAIPGVLNDSGLTSVQVMPMAGVDVRYPWIASGNGINQVIEPIAQFITRPNEQRIGRRPNEDAQSLVFDDTNLFGWNRFSGNDRIEGGTRVNAGVQYSLHAAGNSIFSVLFGQSYHVGGLNSFAATTLPVRDPLGTGLSSGLDKPRSDYVSRISYQFGGMFDVAARLRFDQRSWNVMRSDIDGRVNLGPIQLTTTYSRIAAQPLLGIDRDREGVSGSVAWRFLPNWSVLGGVTYSARNTTDRPGITSERLGLRYDDECFDIIIDYTRTYRQFGDLQPSSSVMVRVNLRSFGDSNWGQGNGGADSAAIAGQPVRFN